MLDEKKIEKMFDKWAPSSREWIDGDFDGEQLFLGFKAAINLLLPIIQKQDEAILFYGDPENYCLTKNVRPRIPWEKILLVHSDVSEMPDIFPCAGKLARSTKQEVSEYINNITGETK